MNRRQFLIVSSIFLAGALGACGLPGATGDLQNQEAAQQFLTERNGGTPVVIGSGGPNAPVVGSIESIDGSKLTVKREIQGTIATVQLAPATKVHKFADAQLSEIKVGDSLTAFGTKQGDVFQANLLRVSGEGDVFGALVIFNKNTGQGGGDAPASGLATNGGENRMLIGGPGGESTMPLTGTVETIDGQSIVLKDKDGASTSLELAGGAKIEKQTEVAPAELAAGMLIFATGTQEGEIYQAMQVQILPTPK